VRREIILPFRRNDK